MDDGPEGGEAGLVIGCGGGGVWRLDEIIVEWDWW